MLLQGRSLQFRVRGPAPPVWCRADPCSLQFGAKLPQFDVGQIPAVYSSGPSSPRSLQGRSRQFRVQGPAPPVCCRVDPCSLEFRAQLPRLLQGRSLKFVVFPAREHSRPARNYNINNDEFVHKAVWLQLQSFTLLDKIQLKDIGQIHR